MQKTGGRGDAAAQPEQDGLFSRYANPTVQMVEDKLATLGTLLSTGDRLLAATEFYGGTSAWLAD